MDAADSARSNRSLARFVQAIGHHGLRAEHEEDMYRLLAKALLDHVESDGVGLYVSERHLHVRAAATKFGVTVEETDRWSDHLAEIQRDPASQGTYYPEPRAWASLPSPFPRHVAELGAQGAFIGPFTCAGEFRGHLILGWSQPGMPRNVTLEHWRALTDIVCLQLNAFRLRMAKHYDPLTGLRNRLDLEARWSRLDRGQSGALFFLDLDGLKAFNDRYGHARGDEYLVRVAEVLSRTAPPRSSLHRLGGDEFALLAPGMTEHEACRLIQAIKGKCQLLGKEFPPHRPNVTVGFALFPEDGTDLYTLLKRADERVSQQRRGRAALTLVTDAGTRGVPLPKPLLETWMDTWPDGIVMTDAERRVIYVNRAYEKMTGYTLQQWLGKTPGFIASGKTSPSTYEDMWEQIATEGSWTGHVINRRRDGKEWVCFLSITRIVDRDGNLVGYLGNARDITKTLWAGEPGVRNAFQEAFTQEALAFALAEAGQIHEGGSRQHLERIRDFTRLLVLGAAERGYEALQRYETRTAIILASILHDIGKLAIPDGLLRKPSKLTPEEYNLIKTHTTAGEELLRSPYLSAGLAAPESEFLATASTIARSHHERWDGLGYPDGLAGEEIPLAARIVSIADVYDALRSARPYKRPWSHGETVEYIAQGAGHQFDPNLVGVFLELADEFKEISRRTRDERQDRSGSGDRPNSHNQGQVVV